MLEAEDALATMEDATVVHVSQGSVSAMVRSEVEAQLSAAHQWPRSITKFLKDAKTMATINQEVAQSCMYSLPRKENGRTKMITGPSVRLAEICASSYCNLQVGARVIDEEDREVVAQGAAWDMERNLRCTIETRRRITTREGRRFSDDMVVTTGNAAASIALRNAIFRVIPRAYVDLVFEEARRVAVGDSKTLDAKRAQVLDRLGKIGVPVDRVLSRLDLKGTDDIGLEHLEVLIGLGTAIKDGATTIEEAFPGEAPAPSPPEQDGRRIKLGKSPPQEAPGTNREPGQEG
jgi:hypothetical protein